MYTGTLLRGPHQGSVSKNKESRKWEVITDPSGDYLGRFFRYMDLQFGLDNWPEGITFQNTVTGERMIWCGRQFISSQPQIEGEQAHA